ncbi:hypothetical protein JCM10213_004202 [Rhodosporidiobolus nylandii]
MSDRSHPLLDRIEATQSGPPSLRAVSESILRIHWSAVTDIGDTPYSLIQSLLPLSSAAQLSLLEANSPHLVPHTNELWKALCVADFIDVRKLVEDGRLKKEDEPRSWRERYAEEEEKREVKMQAILSKMRGQYSSYSSARGTVQEVDGLRMEKRRKTSHASPARPKTLFEKARSNTRAISSIYAPKRRPQPAKAAPAPKPASSTPNSNSLHIRRGAQATGDNDGGSHAEEAASGFDCAVHLQSYTSLRILRRSLEPPSAVLPRAVPPTVLFPSTASPLASPSSSPTPVRPPAASPRPRRRFSVISASCGQMLRSSAHRTLYQHSTRLPAARRFASASSAPSSPPHPRLATAAAIGLAGSLAGALLYTQTLGKAVDLEQEQGKAFDVAGSAAKDHAPVFLWGRNTHSVASPSSSSAVKRPLPSSALSNLVLRDLALSATYGCAVDSQGDVLQWGHGYGGPEGGIERTVVGKDLLQVRPTEQGKVFGLSRKGEVYVWASDKVRQVAGATAEEVKKPGVGLGWKLLGRGLLWDRNNGADVGVEVLNVGADAKLERGEKFISLSTGESHLLALTSSGRAFALPLSLAGNRYGQLGVRAVTLLAPPHPGSSATSALSVRIEPDERLNEMARDRPAPPQRLDPLLLPPVASPTTANPSPKGDLIVSPPPVLAPPTSTTIELHPSPEQHTVLERAPHFCTTLHEIPSLKGVKVAELVAGKNHSIARLGSAMEGRVLGWGANAYGQLGLGTTLSYPSIPTPTEIPLSNSPSYTLNGSQNRPASVKCERVAAGGNVTYFVVSTSSGNGFGSAARESQDLLACGQGQFGGIGNGLWAHATSPVRVKTVSGLSEWNEHAGRVESIKIRDVQAGEGHVAVVLDNAVAHPSGVTFGRDVLVWGQNDHYQLGTGKRSNLPTPAHLPALAGLAVAKPAKEVAGLTNGAAVAVPQGRLQLAATLALSPTLLALNRGLGRRSRVEQAIVAGDGGTGVYWRVVNP